MRILILTQYFWPENFRINDLVVELAGRGHQVTVLTGVPNYPDGKVFDEFSNDPRKFAFFHDIPVIRIPMLPRGQSSVQLMMNYLSFVVSGLTIGTWKLRGREYDAIFVFMVSPITAVLPAILQRKLKRAPLFVWVLDLWPETLSAIGVVKSPRILAMVGHLVSYIYNRTDHILVQSRSFASNVRKYAGVGARVGYFPGWAEPVFSGDLTQVDVAAELSPYRDNFKVLFAGNVGEAQDFPAILSAAEDLADRPDVKIIVVGGGRASQWVASEIERRGIGDRIVMLGRYPLDRMPSFFRGSDALLVTLKSDPVFSMTIPGKIQSYLSAGVPLLGMLDGEGATVIEEAGAGLVCAAGHGNDLARQIRTLADMPAQERAAMGMRARSYCYQEFDRAKLVSQLENWMTEQKFQPHP